MEDFGSNLTDTFIKWRGSGELAAPCLHCFSPQLPRYKQWSLCQVKEFPPRLVAECQQHLADLISSNSSKIRPTGWSGNNLVLISGSAMVKSGRFNFGKVPLSFSTFTAFLYPPQQIGLTFPTYCPAGSLAFAQKSSEFHQQHHHPLSVCRSLLLRLCRLYVSA